MVQLLIIKKNLSVHIRKSLCVSIKMVKGTFCYYHINVRKRLHCYKLIISFNEKGKSKDQSIHGKRKTVIWCEMKGKRDSNLVQQIFNQDSYEKYIKDICGIVNAIFK